MPDCYCSFCSAESSKVKILLAAQRAFICEECVEAAVKAIRTAKIPDFLTHQGSFQAGRMHGMKEMNGALLKEQIKVIAEAEAEERK